MIKKKEKTHQILQKSLTGDWELKSLIDVGCLVGKENKSNLVPTMDLI